MLARLSNPSLSPSLNTYQICYETELLQDPKLIRLNEFHFSITFFIKPIKMQRTPYECE